MKRLISKIDHHFHPCKCLDDTISIAGALFCSKCYRVIAYYKYGETQYDRTLCVEDKYKSLASNEQFEKLLGR